jgi:hypothetical protein
MPSIGVPITCRRCNFRWNDGDFGPGIFGFQDAKNITLNNITTNCPRCGGMASPDDGTYNVRAGHWHLIRGITDDLRSAQATADDYVRLLRLLRQAQATGEGADKVADEIAAQTPFGRLAETIRTHPPGWTAYILAAILAVVLWLVSPPGHSAMPCSSA